MKIRARKYLPGLGFIWIIFCVFVAFMLYTWIKIPVKINNKALFALKKNTVSNSKGIFKNATLKRLKHSGFGDIEGPYQEKNLPKIRWGLGPQSEMIFSSKKSKGKLIFNVCNSLHKEEGISIFLNGVLVRNLFLKRKKMGDFQRVEVSVNLTNGINTLTFKYSKWYKSKSNRKLAVLFSHIEIK